MTKKLIPRLKKGRKLLKGEEGTPVVISRGEYSMTPQGKFILQEPLSGEWLFFNDMATRDSLAYQWYPYEDVAPANAFSNGIPNRKDPYYLKAQELAEQQKKSNKSEKKANKSEKKERGGILKGQDDTKVIDTRENEDNNKYYSINIREGETLSDVARIYGTSVNELMKLNPKIKDKNKIKAGEEILVPFKYSQIPQRTYKTFRNEDIPRDYWNKPYAYEWDGINAAEINLPYPYRGIFLNEGEYEVDSEGNIKTYPMIVPKYYFNEDAAENAKDRYEAWKYGKEEQEFLRNNQLELVPHELLTYHDIPNTREGLLILDNINKIDKDMLLPGYSIHSYVSHGNYPVSIVRDNKGNRVFVLGNEDRLIPKTTLYIVRIGSDYSDPNYLLSLPGVPYKLR